MKEVLTNKLSMQQTKNKVMNAVKKKKEIMF